MEPLKDMSKTPEKRNNATKRRFHIVRLEERIASNKGGTPNGGAGHHYCGYASCWPRR